MRMDGRIKECMNQWIDGWMDGWMDNVIDANSKKKFSYSSLY